MQSLKLHGPRGDVEHGRVKALASEGRAFSVPALLQHLMDFLQTENRQVSRAANLHAQAGPAVHPPLEAHWSHYRYSHAPTLPATSRMLAILKVQLLSLPTGYVQNPRGLMGCRVGGPPATLAGGVRAMGSATPASSLSGSPSLQEQQAA